MKYSIIVLCGGLGSRISSIPNIKVKLLAPINSKIFFDYFTQWLKLNNAITEDLILAIGFNSSSICEYLLKRSLNIKTSIEKIQKGTLPAVIQASALAKYEDVLVLNRDTVFDVCFMDMYAKYLENTKRPLLSLKSLNNKDKIFTNGYSLMGRNNLKFVAESPQFISCGAFFCKKSSLRKEIMTNFQWNNSMKYDLDIHFLDKERCRKYLCAKKYMIDIGTVEDFYKAQKLIPKYINF